MKKLISLTLALCLTAVMTACENSDESSKTAELEKRVAELESQINEQSTTTTTTASTTTTTTTTAEKTTTTTTTEKTTTTTTAATTTPETTTTAQTFDTSYYAWDETERYNTSIELDLYSAPDKNSEILYTVKPNTVFDVCGEVNDDWLAVIYNDQVVFANRWVLSKAYDISLETISIPPIYENPYNF